MTTTTTDTESVGTHTLRVNDDGHYECTTCGKTGAHSDSALGDYLDQTCDEFTAWRESR